MVRKFAALIGVATVILSACVPIYGDMNESFDYGNITLEECRDLCKTEYDKKHCQFFEYLRKNHTCTCNTTNCTDEIRN